jgi:hypothetical protein
MRPQRRVLGDAHAYRVDNLALVGRQALIKEREVGALGAGARRVAALHRFARNARHRLAGQPWIDNSHDFLLCPSPCRRPDFFVRHVFISAFRAAQFRLLLPCSVPPSAATAA